MDIIYLSDKHIVNIFSYLIAYFFILLIVSYDEQRFFFFNFNEAQYSNFFKNKTLVRWTTWYTS